MTELQKPSEQQDAISRITHALATNNCECAICADCRQLLAAYQSLQAAALAVTCRWSTPTWQQCNVSQLLSNLSKAAHASEHP